MRQRGALDPALQEVKGALPTTAATLTPRTLPSLFCFFCLRREGGLLTGAQARPGHPGGQGARRPHSQLYAECVGALALRAHDTAQKTVTPANGAEW